MTATELLRNALEREHEKRISLAKDGERMDIARECVLERDRFEVSIEHLATHPPLQFAALCSAVYALAGVDP